MRWRADITSAGAGIIGLLILVPLFIIKHFNPIYLVAVGTGLAGIVSYLAIFRKPREAQTRHVGTYYWIGAAILCFVLAWLAFLTRSSQYVKPIEYYLFMAVAVSFVVLAVVEQRVSVSVGLGLAIAIGLSHIWTENLMFPGLLGLDPWSHKYTTEALNHLPRILDMGGSYSLMHVTLRGIMDVTGMSYKIAALVFWGSIQTVAIIGLVFLIGRNLFSKEVGLIAALMVSSANWIIFFGEWVIPNGMGAAMSLLVGYLFIKAHNLKKPWVASLSLLVLPVAFLTHPIVSMWVAGTIACMSLMYLREKKAFAVVTGIGAMVGLGVWFLLSSVGRATVAFSGGTYAVGNAPTLEFSYLSVVSWEILVNAAGMFAYFGVAIIGLLIMTRHRLAQVWVLLVVVVLAIGIVPPLFGKSFIEHRWWYLADVLICVPLGLAIVSIFKLRSGMAVIPCVGAMVFFSTIGLPSNTTNRALSQHQIVRYALTQGELDALPIARSYNPKLLGSDPLFMGTLITELQNHTAVAIDAYILSGNFTDCPCDVIILRDALYKEPFGYGSGAIYSLETNPVDYAVIQGYTEVWRNNESHVLVRK
jgi:hypothetical protein